MRIFHISNESCEVEYIWITEDSNESVEEILEEGESVDNIIPITPNYSLPLNRKLIAER